MDKYSMKSIFEEELSIQGFRFRETSNGHYTIIPKSRIVQPINLQLVISRPINEIIHGCQIGELDAIGYFLFRLNSEQSTDFMVFAFRHLRNGSPQFMIIPTDELRSRLEKNRIKYFSGKCFDFRLWLIDNKLYDSTFLNFSGEYFYLSESRGVRKIDATIWNYSRYLNRWVLGFPE
jgi:hypothetical protein